MRPYLEQAAGESLDPEVRSRLRRSLRLLPHVEDDPAHAMCDELLPTHDPQWQLGDAGSWNMECEFHGHRVSIDRKKLRRERGGLPRLERFAELDCQPRELGDVVNEWEDFVKSPGFWNFFLIEVR